MNDKYLKSYKMTDGKEFGGSSYITDIEVDYDTLVSLFGEPDDGSADYKVEYEWNILFEDGRRTCIHNWKDGIGYLGELNGLLAKDIKKWVISGFAGDEIVVLYIKALIHKHLHGDTND